jgi:hypothetical protein
VDSFWNDANIILLQAIKNIQYLKPKNCNLCKRWVMKERYAFTDLIPQLEKRSLASNPRRRPSSREALLQVVKSWLHAMERVGADDHPLSSSSHNYFFSSGISTSSIYNDPGQPRQQQARSPAASLIQSAARSVLDNLTPSIIVSDAGGERCSCSDGTIGNLRPASSPTLRSLQVKTLPAIPDEQDRRRFIVSTIQY